MTNPNWSVTSPYQDALSELKVPLRMTRDQSFEREGGVMIQTFRLLKVGIAAALCGLASCGAQDGPVSNQADTFELSEPEMIASGREIVEAQCVMCHAIGANDQSPRTDAPPLRTVLANYAPEALADDFREGVHVGHPDMPDFDFGPIGTDHVLAYLISIQDSGAGTE